MIRATVVLMILALASCEHPPKQRPSVTPADPVGSHAPASSILADPPRQAPLRIGGDVLPPVLVKRVEPDASECQTRMHLGGGAFVEALIDEAGVPKNVRIIKSIHPCIDRALVQAVEQWRFSPATLHGRPVPVMFHMTSRIKLE